MPLSERYPTYNEKTNYVLGEYETLWGGECSPPFRVQMPRINTGHTQVAIYR